MATIKTELTSGVRFPTRHEARLVIFDHIESFYNRRRRHFALENRSRLVFEQIHATLTSAEAGAVS
jgi:transposase InsO family protein